MAPETVLQLNPNELRDKYLIQGRPGHGMVMVGGQSVSDYLIMDKTRYDELRLTCLAADKKDLIPSQSERAANLQSAVLDSLFLIMEKRSELEDVVISSLSFSETKKWITSAQQTADLRARNKQARKKLGIFPAGDGKVKSGSGDSVSAKSGSGGKSSADDSEAEKRKAQSQKDKLAAAADKAPGGGSVTVDRSAGAKVSVAKALSPSEEVRRKEARANTDCWHWTQGGCARHTQGACDFRHIASALNTKPKTIQNVESGSVEIPTPKPKVDVPVPEDDDGFEVVRSKKSVAFDSRHEDSKDKSAYMVVLPSEGVEKGGDVWTPGQTNSFAPTEQVADLLRSGAGAVTDDHEVPGFCPDYVSYDSSLDCIDVMEEGYTSHEPKLSVEEIRIIAYAEKNKTMHDFFSTKPSSGLVTKDGVFVGGISSDAQLVDSSVSPVIDRGMQVDAPAVSAPLLQAPCVNDSWLADSVALSWGVPVDLPSDRIGFGSGMFDGSDLAEWLLPMESPKFDIAQDSKLEAFPFLSTNSDSFGNCNCQKKCFDGMCTRCMQCTEDSCCDCVAQAERLFYTTPTASPEYSTRTDF